MKVLGILGSPRRGGNSEILLNKALEGAVCAGCAAEKIALSELKFEPCRECAGCDKSGRCVIKDDMQFIYKKLDEAAAVILAAPIFFGSLPAQVKAMIDRYQCRWVAKYILGQKSSDPPKKGSLILVSAGNRDKFFRNAESIVRNFFAVAAIEFVKGIYCPNIDKKAGILDPSLMRNKKVYLLGLEHPDYLKQAFELGKKRLLKNYL